MRTLHTIGRSVRILSIGIALTAISSQAQLAKGASKFLGNITQTNSGNPASGYGDLWNQATAENGCKWGSVEGTKGTFNWSACDVAYNWAKNNGGHFKFHALLWGSQYPSWLESLSKDDTKTAITKWFDAVKSKYADIEMIDVVNEAIRTGTNQYHSNFQKTQIREALGGDNNGDYKFITTAFQMARDRWPKAILIYNDYNTFQWQVDEGITLIKTIKNAGAPVDAYGQQAHDLNGMDVNTLKTTIAKIHDQVGIPLFITEYDIASTNDDTQKKYYSEQIPVFWEAEYVAGVTLWGYIYGQTWTDDGKGYSGLIKNGTDRSAMTWLRDYMKNNKGKNTTGFGGGTTGIENHAASVVQAPKSGVTIKNVNGRLLVGIEKDGRFTQLDAIGRN